MTKKVHVNELSPDGYSRFFIMVDVLQQIYGKSSKTIKILDVGGGSEFFSQRLNASGLQYDLTVLDIIPRPNNVKVTYIQGDATNMKLEDDSFDVVVSTDVMEHIPERFKQAYLNECLRVAKELCIIAAPFSTIGVNDAEIVVNEFNKDLFGTGQDWLEEHLERGKPTKEMMSRTLDRRKVPYNDFGTQNLTTWLLNTHINLIDAKLGLDGAAHKKVNKFYNDNILMMSEFTAPTYRHFFVMYKNAKLQTLFNPGRYSPTVNDTEKAAVYISRLFGLFAERIATQSKSIETSDRQVQRVNKEIAVLQMECQALRATVQQQAEKLSDAEPILKVLRKKPIRRAVSIVRKVKR